MTELRVEDRGSARILTIDKEQQMNVLSRALVAELANHARQASMEAKIRVVIVTLDNHLASAVERARLRLRSEMPGLVLGFHAAAEWETDPSTLEACRADIAQADIVLSAMLFMESAVPMVLQ